MTGLTIQELYTLVDGDYDQAVKVMKKDKLIDKYIRKLKDSNLNEVLTEAGKTMNAKALFDGAHAMKGVCSNLGLCRLQSAAEEISEEFREGNSRTMSDEAVKEKLSEIDRMFKKTLEGIAQYEAET